MIAKSLRVARCIVPLALVAMAGCDSDDSTGPGGGLNITQRAALVAAINGNPALVTAMFGSGNGAMAGAMLPYVAMGLQSIGTIEISAGGAPTLITPNGVRQSLGAPVRADASVPLTGTYQAFGAQIVMTIKTGQTPAQNLVWSGIVAMNNLNTPTDIISTGVLQLNTTTAPSSIASVSFGGEQSETKIASATYVEVDGQQTRVYAATSGQIGITSATFTGGSTTCAGTAVVPMIKLCNYTAGTIEGNFNFSAPRVSGTGGSPGVTVPATTVSVPAVRVKFSYDLTAAN